MAGRGLEGRAAAGVGIGRLISPGFSAHRLHCPTYFSPAKRGTGSLRDEASRRGMVLRSGALIQTKRVKGKEVVIMGINTPKKNRNDETTADQNLVDGLGKHASTIPAFVVGGATVATKDIARHCRRASPRPKPRRPPGQPGSRRSRRTVTSAPRPRPSSRSSSRRCSGPSPVRSTRWQTSGSRRANRAS